MPNGDNWYSLLQYDSYNTSATTSDWTTWSNNSITVLPYGGQPVIIRQEVEPLTDEPLPEPKAETEPDWLRRRVAEVLWHGDKAA